MAIAASVLVDSRQRGRLPHPRGRVGHRALPSPVSGGSPSRRVPESGGVHGVLADVVDDLSPLRWRDGGHSGATDGLGALLRLGPLADELRVREVVVLLARERLGRGL